MRDTKIMIAGRLAMVEAAHAKTFLKKQELVAEALALQKAIQSNPKLTFLAYDLGRVTGKIIKINRKIKSAGMFCTFVSE